jgi:hypothetical protein
VTIDRSADDTALVVDGLASVWHLPLIEDATPMGQLQREIREAWIATAEAAPAPPHSV